MNRRFATKRTGSPLRSGLRIMLWCSVGGFMLWWWLFALADPLFDDPYSTILLDRDGHLLSARIATDEQWRFPETEAVPAKFRTALLAFEDKRFYLHPGVDPLAMGRAIRSNIRAGRIVSGGSTLTMQLIRISRKGGERNIREKLIEVLLALRAECRYTKDEILRLYASHAPFGGNVVGIEAASWRYFGKPPESLSWSEAACLAVLPNSPALIHPGRGRTLLRDKRDNLLLKLTELGHLDSLESVLARMEPLPDAPLPLPDDAPHLLSYLRKSGGSRIHTTIHRQFQKEAEAILRRHHNVLAQNQIQNGAILILDTDSGEVLAYVGNVKDAAMPHENAVDMIQAERSSGSILKPLLYASAFHSGQLLPTMLIEDVPTSINGYQPENFTRTYSGMVPANTALIQSLNVPAVRLLRKYGIEFFRQELIACGLRTIRYPADHYGLPLILGGAEVTLWDITGVYAGMGRMLSHAYPLNHRYDPADIHPPVALIDDTLVTQNRKVTVEPFLWDYGSLWLTLESMKNLSRPAEDGQWESFQSEKAIAWKTGTSFGFRDAWAIGVTPDYTVGVWIGNADGEGRPGLIGVRAAAPVMFDVFRNLPGKSWWSPPYDALDKVAICRESGYLAGDACPASDSMWITKGEKHAGRCPYHVRIFTTRDGSYRMYQDCASPDTLIAQAFLVLPPGPGSYYGKSHPAYKPLPPLRPDCRASSETAMLDLIYPDRHTRIYLPRELNGEAGKAVFKAAHRLPDASIFWYLDRTYLGRTLEFHTMAIHATPGVHTLTIVDQNGDRVEQTFEVAGP